MTNADKYEKALQYQHDNPPPPFNPHFDPKAKERAHKVTQSLENDNYYSLHPRSECAKEWRRRYDKLKEDGS